jgi:hypothetical protein
MRSNGRRGGGYETVEAFRIRLSSIGIIIQNYPVEEQLPKLPETEIAKILNKK